MDVIKRRQNLGRILVILLLIFIVFVAVVDHMSNSENKISEYNERGKQIAQKIREYENSIRYDEEGIRKSADVLIPLYKQLYSLKAPRKLKKGHRVIKMYCDAKIRELQYFEEYSEEKHLTMPEKIVATEVKLTIESDISNAIQLLNDISFKQTGIEIFNEWTWD